MTLEQFSLRHHLLVSFATRYINVAVNFSLMVALARLLTPSEFGVVAVVSVFVSFFNILGSTGINTGVVQNQELSEKDLSDIYKVTCGVALLLALLFCAFAEGLAFFYQNQVYRGIARLLSLALFFNVLSMVPQALLQKRKDFRRIGVIQVVATTVGGGVAVLCAIGGGTFYAIVFQSIATAACSWGLFFWQSGLRLHQGFSWNGLHKIRRYSFYQFLFNFINYFARNSDNILVGKVLGAPALGFYDRAYQMMLMPVQYLTFAITPVLHPVLATHQSDPRFLFDQFLKVARILVFLGCFVGPACVLNARDLVQIVLGDQWTMSANLFQILAFSVPFQMICSSTGAMFQAAGDTRRMFWSGFLNAALILGAIVFTLSVWHSLRALAVGVSVAYVSVFFTTIPALVVLTLRSSLSQFGSLLLPYVVAGGLTMALVTLLPMPANAPFRLALRLLAATIFYLIAVRFLPGGRPVFSLLFRKKAR